MHQSFVSTAPPRPWNSGAFNVSVFKALLKARYCWVRFVVNSGELNDFVMVHGYKQSTEKHVCMNMVKGGYMIVHG